MRVTPTRLPLNRRSRDFGLHQGARAEHGSETLRREDSRARIIITFWGSDASFDEEPLDQIEQQRSDWRIQGAWADSTMLKHHGR